MKPVSIAGILVASMLAGCVTAEPADEGVEASALRAQGSGVENDYAAAQQGGPFSSIQAIQNYHTANHDSWRVVNFVDGTVVQDLFGFGPAEINQYFLCDDWLYRAVCPDPYSRAQDLDTLAAFFEDAGTVVYLDNVLYKARTAPGFDTVHITTCYGDTSPAIWGQIRYYRVTLWWDEWGTLIEGRGCTDL